MITRICKSFDFDAAHHLPRMPDGHKCRRPHGHTYYGEVEFVGEPDENGILVEYGEVAEVINFFDHQDLNVLLDTDCTTTELLVRILFDRMAARFGHRARVARVRLHESQTTWAEVTG